MSSINNCNVGSGQAADAESIIHDIRNKLANIGAYLHASRKFSMDKNTQTIYQNAVEEQKAMAVLLNTLDLIVGQNLGMAESKEEMEQQNSEED